MAEKWFEYDDVTGEISEIPNYKPHSDHLIIELLYENGGDQHGQDLFNAAVFDKDDIAYQQLVDYMWDQYGIDFEDAFSWETAREAYDRGAI